MGGVRANPRWWLAPPVIIGFAGRCGARSRKTSRGLARHTAGDEIFSDVPIRLSFSIPGWSMSPASVAAPASPAANPGSAYDQHPERRVLYAILVASTCIIAGLIWDISWHMTIGRDTLWSPPHLLGQIGAAVAGLSCGAYVLWVTFAGSAPARARSVRFWGFRGPLGAWVCIWGALTIIVSVPFDDWWHNAYGLDVEILSPPHAVLAAGMIAVQIGALLLALSVQNTAAPEDARRFGWLYAYAAGVLVTMAAVVGFERIGHANHWHRAGFYQITAAVFPLFLLGVARASRLRWPATITAATYMVIILLMNWVLQMFPAQPMLAPIYNPVDRMVPMAFPLVLVLPAFGIDLVMRRMRGAGDWRLAGAAGLAFVALMLVVHWPFAEFLLSPAARNPIFGADQWPYTVQLGPWRYQYWGLDVGPDGAWSPLAFGRGTAVAVVIAVLSARIGLAWGGWMRRVVR